MNEVCYRDILIDSLRRHSAAFESLRTSEIGGVFEKACEAIVHSVRSGKKILIAGNGGSAADAQHFSAELVCKFKEFRDPVPCIALTTDTSYLTATANDYHFDDIFTRQVKALGNMGDVFIALSTSGNSKNILQAIEMAKKKGMIVIGLSGKGGGKMREVSSHFLCVGAEDTASVQEAHIALLHMFCRIIDQKIFQLKT